MIGCVLAALVTAASGAAWVLCRAAALGERTARALRHDRQPDL